MQRTAGILQQFVLEVDSWLEAITGTIADIGILLLLFSVLVHHKFLLLETLLFQKPLTLILNF